MHKKYPVDLSDIERAEMACLIAAGTASTRKLLRAQVLFNADQSEAGSAWVAGSITEAVGVRQPTVIRTRKQHMSRTGWRQR